MSNHTSRTPEPASAFFTGPGAAGVGLALLTTAVWSINYVVSRGIIQEMPPLTLSFLRWSVALLVLLPFTAGQVIRHKGHFLDHWQYYLLLGLSGIAMPNTFTYIAAHSVEAINLSLIATSAPLFVLIFARTVYGEPMTLSRGAGVCTVLAGIVLLISRGDPLVLVQLEFHAGDLWMLASAMSFALYVLLLRKQPGQADTFAGLTVVFAAGWASLIPFTIWEISGHPGMEFSPPVLYAILYMGLGASIFCFWTWGKAVALIGPSRAAMIYYTMPFFCGLQAVLFLDEPLHWVHFASGLLILGGLLAATRRA